MKPSGPKYEISTITSKPNRDNRASPCVAGKRTGHGADGPNGAGRMAYALARLRASDEARSAELDRDPRVMVPDEDEESQRPCGARRGS